MDILIFILFCGLLVLGSILKDWLIYKHHGRAKPNHPDETNPPVITGPADAIAQRQIDRCNPPRDRQQ